MSRTVNAYAALTSGSSLEPWTYEQRTPREHDVVFDVQFCGICHTDIHMIGPWGQSFPMVPGHEMVGRVTEVGSGVHHFAVGDLVGVGPVVDSCRKCEPCLAGLETYCLEGATSAYGVPDRVDGSPTRGGFADSVVCDERFVHRMPDGLDPAAAAPLLCAGITTYSPLRHWNIGPGSTVGVIGIGGLGHLGIKFARAMGAEVVAFTTSQSKAQAALALGAHEVVMSRSETQMASQANRFDFLLDTVSATYPMTPFVQALKMNGTLCSLGLPGSFDVAPFALAMRRSIAGSGAGGTVETREMLQFCVDHKITADVEIVAPDEINTALERLDRGDVAFRFVVDMAR
ncbi:NAD(P)-dependent alcohol dehydrogenase [Kineosporia sp. NBRC 101731]|uniref:NAD(P)-dependent alcohol dehydrogenase n=1 Tax=Kineosporia sp. NBRC 101731 TaxID=3032199 RepID=UPI0024A34737|nr:NAD(P)-dependent alcohol dehydrogenase [Kineosporia sp. NBRC 101731]GLY28816.1 alcohol dehydrogenase [Kineosporia sp. NBRC 101731]